MITAHIPKIAYRSDTTGCVYEMHLGAPAHYRIVCRPASPENINGEGINLFDASGEIAFNKKGWRATILDFFRVVDHHINNRVFMYPAQTANHFPQRYEDHL